MDYNVYYGIPTYSQFARAEEAVHAVLAGTIVPNQVVIIDNSETGAGFTALKHLPEQYANVHILPRTKNILSGAWNDLMQLWPDDYVIIANDDVKPYPHTIEAFITAAINRPEVAMWNGNSDQTRGVGGNSYSLFLLRQWAYKKVGPFDERFVPAYFEDNDFDYRLIKLAGLIREEVKAATFDHAISSTVRNMTPAQQELQHIAFRKNQRYYISKWGDVPHKERYKIPFAGIDLSDL